MRNRLVIWREYEFEWGGTARVFAARGMDRIGCNDGGDA
jgi:hypothetical protein